ncbi:MAG: MotA/TolQ/ExbB proton channel family protein [Magnetococcales bacterium]|nr:MotA/TolQ/ExbB proton channel family protein [Magnetococcales bacterium]
MIGICLKNSALTLLILLFCPLSALAQPVDSLYKLQQRMEETRKRESAIRTEREQGFIAVHADRKRLLKEMRQRLADEQKRSETLRKSFAENEASLVSLERELHQSSGDLGEVFGTVRRTAKDLVAPVSESMVSAHYPDRVRWLTELGERKKLPDMSELTQLWHLMQQEIIQSGQVVGFPARVVGVDGVARQQKVIRAGLFTAVSQGHYLHYRSESSLFTILSRQPSATDRALAAELGETKDGFAEMVLDPTRGVLLEMLVEIPNHLERIKQGGVVGYAILVLGLVGLILGLWRLFYLTFVGRKIFKQLKNPAVPSATNPLGRILAVAKEKSRNNLKNVEMLIDEAILLEIPALTRGERLMKLLAAIAPLLGLLGTVIGMIVTFQAISLFGTGDPKLMAGGISQALVTTTLGLIVAVPLLFLHTLVVSRSRALVRILEQQSAGLIAMVWEKA